MAEDGEIESQCLPAPIRFPAGADPWPVHPPREEGGRLERHGFPRASLSGRARHACPVHLPYRTPDSNWEPSRPERDASTNWASSACERLTGIEPVTSTMARWCSGLLSYNRMERVTGLEPALRPWESRVLPVTPHSHRASARSRTGYLPLTRRLLWPGELQRRACPRRDSNAHYRRPQRRASYLLGYEDMRAATRCRPGSSAVRRRSRSRARRRGWGTRARTWTLLGQNQMCCLITPFPIEYAGRDLNPQTARFELASFAGLALPARAPPEARTPFPGLRVRCITRHACGAQKSRTGESNPDILLGRQMS